MNLGKSLTKAQMKKISGGYDAGTCHVQCCDHPRNPDGSMPSAYCTGSQSTGIGCIQGPGAVCQSAAAGWSCFEGGFAIGSCIPY